LVSTSSFSPLVESTFCIHLYDPTHSYLPGDLANLRSLPDTTR
jgi:hypothetical protein